jgi:pyrroline-5-carboxylate reductase
MPAISKDFNIAFIGGGNMASAILSGLLKEGLTAQQVQVVEPFAEQAARLRSQFGVEVQAQAGADLKRSALVVWAVKPQIFREAAAQTGAHTRQALHLSVAAGIRSDSIASWLDSERVVRAMPNTPALIGQGITGLFARAAVTAADRTNVEAVVQSTGQQLWLAHEEQLDAVTALSGSGPAYVFYFIEAMTEAGQAMGLTQAQSRQLAIATFGGASALAAASDEPPQTLRERVTSKGGTTHAAITAMQASGIKAQFMEAMQAARRRAAELGDEFGSAAKN